MKQTIDNTKIMYSKLGRFDKLRVDATRLTNKLPLISSIHGGRGSKRRGITIKRRRRQQKQHKTRKHGRKYRASRPNKKTRKHLVRGRGRPHRRTRSH